MHGRSCGFGRRMIADPTEKVKPGEEVRAIRNDTCP
jgi:hypothetical protein